MVSFDLLCGILQMIILLLVIIKYCIFAEIMIADTNFTFPLLNFRDAMNAIDNRSVRQPVIVRTTETERPGIRSFDFSRCALGYVLSGRKYIYMGDRCREAGPGDIFFLSKGTHYIEEVPEGRKPFEQIVFFYSPQQLARIVSQLSVNHRIDVRIHHSCEECCGRSYVIAHGWDALKHFFNATNQHLRGGLFARDQTAEVLRLTELIYHVVSQPECCLRTRVLGSTDPEKEFFEQSAYDYVFSDINLEELAHRNNRSLTAFKKMFKGYFNDPPHRWVVRQRLMHARLLLISTNRPVAQIGVECRFPNTSHFIKLFGKEFGMTPAAYRRKYSSDISRRKEQMQPEEA